MYARPGTKRRVRIIEVHVVGWIINVQITEVEPQPGWHTKWPHPPRRGDQMKLPTFSAVKTAENMQRGHAHVDIDAKWSPSTTRALKALPGSDNGRWQLTLKGGLARKRTLYFDPFWHWGMLCACIIYSYIVHTANHLTNSQTHERTITPSL